MKLARPILRLSCKLVFGAFASSKTSPKTILGLPLAKGLRYTLTGSSFERSLQNRRLQLKKATRDALPIAQVRPQQGISGRAHVPRARGAEVHL